MTFVDFLHKLTRYTGASVIDSAHWQRSVPMVAADGRKVKSKMSTKTKFQFQSTKPQQRQWAHLRFHYRVSVWESSCFLSHTHTHSNWLLFSSVRKPMEQQQFIIVPWVATVAKAWWSNRDVEELQGETIVQTDGGSQKVWSLGSKVPESSSVRNLLLSPTTLQTFITSNKKLPSSCSGWQSREQCQPPFNRPAG